MDEPLSFSMPSFQPDVSDQVLFNIITQIDNSRESTPHCRNPSKHLCDTCMASLNGVRDKAVEELNRRRPCYGNIYNPEPDPEMTAYGLHPSVWSD